MAKEELQVLFCAKISLENGRFRQKMLNQKPEEVFAHAYQIDCMINIYELMMVMSQEMGEGMLKKLVIFPNLLAFIYKSWMKQEDSYTRELQDCIGASIVKLPEIYQDTEEGEGRAA